MEPENHQKQPTDSHNYSWWPDDCVDDVLFDLGNDLSDLKVVLQEGNGESDIAPPQLEQDYEGKSAGSSYNLNAPCAENSESDLGNIFAASSLVRDSDSLSLWNNNNSPASSSPSSSSSSPTSRETSLAPSGWSRPISLVAENGLGAGTIGMSQGANWNQNEPLLEGRSRSEGGEKDTLHKEGTATRTGSLQGTIETFPQEMQLHRSCRICAKPCGRHNFYGTQSCQSCRVFFSRSVKTGLHAAFTCDGRGDGNKDCPCLVDYTRKRRNCKWCRFQKCLQAGMILPRMLVPMTDKKSGGSSEHEQHRPNRMIRPVGLPPRIVTCYGPLTLDESLYLKGLTSFATGLCDTELNRYFLDRCVRVQGHSLSSQPTIEFADPSTVLFDVRPQMYGQLYGKLFEVIGDKEWLALGQTDKMLLARKNAPVLNELALLARMDSSEEKQGCLGLFRGVLQDWAAAGDEKCRFVLSALNENHEAVLANSYMTGQSYDAMHTSPWALSWDVEQRHKALYNKIRRAFRDDEGASGRHTNRVMDDTDFLLTFLVLAFSSGSDCVENGGLVESIRQKYAFLLYRYLSSKHGQAHEETINTGYLQYSMRMETIQAAIEAEEIKATKKLIV